MNSEDSKTVTFKTTKWHTTVTFHPDRIVSVSDRWGFGFDTFEVEVPKDEASESLQVQTTYGWGARSNFLTAGFWAIAFLAFRYLFENWVTYLSWLALLGLVSASIAGIMKLRKLTWLSILRSNGSRAITVCIPSRDEKAIEEFKSSYSEYKNKVEPVSPYNSSQSLRD